MGTHTCALFGKLPSLPAPAPRAIPAACPFAACPPPPCSHTTRRRAGGAAGPHAVQPQHAARPPRPQPGAAGRRQPVPPGAGGALRHPSRPPPGGAHLRAGALHGARGGNQQVGALWAVVRPAVLLAGAQPCCMRAFACLLPATPVPVLPAHSFLSFIGVCHLTACRLPYLRPPAAACGGTWTAQPCTSGGWSAPATS